MERQAQEILLTDEDERIRCSECGKGFVVRWSEADCINNSELGICPKCGTKGLSSWEIFEGLLAAGSLMDALPSEIEEQFGIIARRRWGREYGGCELNPGELPALEPSPNWHDPNYGMLQRSPYPTEWMNRLYREANGLD